MKEDWEGVCCLWNARWATAGRWWQWAVMGWRWLRMTVCRLQRLLAAVGGCSTRSHPISSHDVIAIQPGPTHSDPIFFPSPGFLPSSILLPSCSKRSAYTRIRLIACVLGPPAGPSLEQHTHIVHTPRTASYADTAQTLCRRGIWHGDHLGASHIGSACTQFPPRNPLHSKTCSTVFATFILDRFSDHDEAHAADTRSQK